MFFLTARINLSPSEAKRILGNRTVGDNRLFSRNGWSVPSVDNHANRGMSFEGLINQANEFYRQNCFALITKVPTEFIPIRRGGQIISTKVVRKSGVDYIGVFNGTPIAVEAKSTRQNRLSYNEVHPHQEKFLDDWVDNGGVAFVLVSFGLKDFFLIPWEYWKISLSVWRNRKEWKRNLRDVYFGKYTDLLNYKASLSVDELSPMFRVFISQRRGFLDYLGKEKL